MSLPPVFVMVVITHWFVVRRLGGSRESVMFGHVHRLGLGVDAPGLETVRAAFSSMHTVRRSCIGIVGRRFGRIRCKLGIAWRGGVGLHISSPSICLASTNSSHRSAPLVVLGLQSCSGFPLAGLLNAKASAADSVFEACGVAALMSIVALTVLLLPNRRQ
ncbi:MAG: hypothetical protein QM784_39990 [Polyangiaceae bacterium]